MLTRSTRLVRRLAAATVAIGMTATVLVVSTPSSSAHAQRRLAARILDNNVGCEEATYPFCEAVGRVRVRNNRAPGTGRIVICVGIDVHTARHRSLSIEPPLPDGQAVAYLRPGRSRVVPYRTVFNDEAGVADHVHVTHVHKHVANGGRLC